MESFQNLPPCFQPQFDTPAPRGETLSGPQQTRVKTFHFLLMTFLFSTGPIILFFLSEIKLPTARGIRMDFHSVTVNECVL